MNDDQLNFHDELYALSHIERYSTVKRITTENVAEHSFYVSSIIVSLHDIYHFDLGRSLLMSVIHDWPEAWIGDITVKVKNRFPSLKAEVLNAEKAIVTELFSPSVSSAWHEYSNGETIESKIVHLADVIQCVQYSSQEVKLGNTGYMQEVLQQSHKRMLVLQNLLENHKRVKVIYE